MRPNVKSEQLQIRVSGAQKEAIQRAAACAGVDMSTYVLGRVLPDAAALFRVHVEDSGRSDSAYSLAQLNSLLAAFTSAELLDAVSTAPTVSLSPFLANYIAAMVEYVCAKRLIAVPAWTGLIPPLTEPAFGSTLKSLRLHLLTHSPPPFRCRNLFIDATVGDQV